MYKCILIAVDGSEVAAVAVRHGVALAKAFGAKAIFVNVSPPWESLVVGDAVVMFPPADYEESMAKAASKVLDTAAGAARLEGVPCDTVHLVDAQIHAALIDTARKNGCDLIVMGSHGRHGLEGLLLGSVATKTVTSAHIPVLICRN
ncbi:MAG: universal stress protein [Hyphomicrobium sp.]|nr:universal stress protein [Hyphomicrobium sp.]